MQRNKKQDSLSFNMEQNTCFLNNIYNWLWCGKMFLKLFHLFVCVCMFYSWVFVSDLKFVYRFWDKRMRVGCGL